MKMLLALVIAVAGIAASAEAVPATVHPAVAKKVVTAGFYRGQTIGYFDFGPIKLKPGNKLVPLWTVTNPATGQHNIVDIVPGQAGYSPLWQINKRGILARHTPERAGAFIAARIEEVRRARTRSCSGRRYAARPKH